VSLSATVRLAEVTVTLLNGKTKTLTMFAEDKTHQLTLGIP